MAKRMLRKILDKYLLTVIVMHIVIPITATNYTPELEKALQQAGKNRNSLEQVLKHYANNKEKYQAACFLIENMVGHSQAGRVVYYDPQVDVFRRQIDSAYYAMVKGKSTIETNTPEFKKQLSSTDKIYRDKIEAYPFKQAQIEEIDLPDIQTLDANFLIRHIDNAFDKRKKVTFARQLNFQDFCSYVLPYRVINDYPLVQESKLFTDFFSKYIQADKASNVNEVVERYNQTTSRLRWFMGKYPFETNIGFNELFFNSFFDCVDMAHYGASALRAAGIPVAVEYNVAYKIWSGKHYFVSTLDAAGRWCVFTPERNGPSYRPDNFRNVLNIFRIQFDKQQHNPTALKAPSEEIPENLSSPYIEDVSSNTLDVVSLTLPFNVQTTNKLAYLVTFQSEQGLLPATWGLIEASKKQVRFANVVLDNLYFPMYYNSEQKLVAFGTPFWIQTDSLQKATYKMTSFNPQNSKPINVDLVRKFPRKPSMEQMAATLKGVVVIAADNSKFLHADTLYRINTTPDDYWQEMNLNNTKAYRYYRIENRADYPHLPIGEIEFLTHKKYNYSNVMPATALPLLPSSQVPKEDSLIRLLYLPLEKCKWKAEYDGNVQTSTEYWRGISFNLKEPQIVSHIRFVPKNEDNRVRIGDFYILSEWDGNEWKKLLAKKADLNYIHAEGLVPGRMYWLCNKSNGKEELPFVVTKNGEQKFIHEDLLRILQQ